MMFIRVSSLLLSLHANQYNYHDYQGISTVCDAEALLDSAVRISKIQNVFLPLFSMLNVDAPIETGNTNTNTHTDDKTNT